MAAFNVASAEIIGVRMTESGETAKQEDIADWIQVSLGPRQLKIADTGHLLLGKVDYLLLGCLQSRLERLVGHVRIVTVFSRPIQEPTEKAQFLFDGRVLQADDVIMVVLFPVPFLLTGSPMLHSKRL